MKKIKSVIIKKVTRIIKNIIGDEDIEFLIGKGLKVGRNFSKQQGCFLDPSHCFLIEIGDNVTFSTNVKLLAHDASTKKILGYTKIGQIIIGDSVFIGANVVVLPNIKIGKNSIIGSGSVVTKNVPDNVVVAGNPAKFICTLEEYEQKYQSIFKQGVVFDESYLIGNITGEKKAEMKEELKKGVGFLI
ncbi:MAG: acyltransferase [Culicoidibacterales bacterium]